MSENKTVETNESVEKFLQTIEDEQQQKDSYVLVDIFKEVSGSSPKLWGNSILGFGNYHYKYKSGREGDWFYIGFSPRKGKLSLYVYSDTADNQKLLKSLGKYKMGKSCIYVKKLDDIDQKVLRQICSNTTRRKMDEDYQGGC